MWQTYIGDGIVLAVKDNFADPPSHLHVGYERRTMTGYPNQYGDG
jgi:hypothetical protein